MHVVTFMSSLSSSSFLRFLLVTLAFFLLGLSGRLVLGIDALHTSRLVLNSLSRHLFIPVLPIFILGMVGIPFPRLSRGRCTTR